MLSPALAAIPAAPTSLSMPETAEWIFLGTSVALLLVTIGLGVRLLARDSDATLLLCVLGGMAASLLEPVIDIAGLMYLPEEGAMGAFTFFDRTMPLFVITAYGGYIGGLTYYAYSRYRAGVIVRDVFVLWFAFFVSNVAFETPAVLLDVYTYYGQQPLNLWGFPLWWGFVNPLTGMAAAAVIFRLKDTLLAGRGALLIVPLIFAADGAVNGATATPMWLTLNDTEIPHVWTWVAALITLGLVLGVVRLIAVGVATGDRPAALGQPAAASATPSAVRSDARSTAV